MAKMLASGMDEATAYQYLQQMCGNAGKGSKPKTFDPKVSTSPKMLYIQLCPCLHPSVLKPTSIFCFTNTCKTFSVFICVLDFLYLALLLLATQHYTSMLCNLCSVCQQPPSLLKSHLPAETLCNSGGAVSFRTAEESVENAKEILNAFDRAIAKHKNRPKIEVPKRKLPPCQHPAYPLSSCFSFHISVLFHDTTKVSP